ncbi:aspartyl-phosphate phosphatase Spo0E family protein [Clostridium nigeriense]
MDKIEQLRKELEELYIKEGLTEKVVELSKKLDELIIEIQLKNKD